MLREGLRQVEWPVETLLYTSEAEKSVCWCYHYRCLYVASPMNVLVPLCQIFQIYTLSHSWLSLYKYLGINLCQKNGF